MPIRQGSDDRRGGAGRLLGVQDGPDRSGPSAPSSVITWATQLVPSAGASRPSSARQGRQDGSDRRWPLRVDIPRDRGRQLRFAPILIPKHERHFTGFDNKIIAIYVRGMTVR
ncbi:protein of unknown function (plasmid) [Cupriavidus taiwanensis]|uniref:Transposase n=1 Tax=Cupriavidus taiwanensis TaxID=164546 RepID=A0A375FIE6_9BURK|nr:hypothetical protein CBM2614_U10010 [Cupriavidus taiwanensis]SOZ73292.1 hypothetical protein CBM2615_U10007 [Cupriavidus taiwanensis]SOZ75210.1 hypothetical protein CBM2613_U10112 [Cupriavidus taiwanensis]SPA03682.1 protein of unknown function [Cupriavidus taiwanensis]SPA57488.1 protein of unknown function [Cupriavidus taiwanensis]